MPLDRVSPGTSVIDVLDHVLEKGIVVDAWLRLSVAGIDLVTVEARIVVASIGTYLAYAGDLAEVAPLSRAVSGIASLDFASNRSLPAEHRTFRRS